MNTNGPLTLEEKRALARELLAKKAAAPRRGPLSFSQQRMWFVEQLQPGSALYNMHGAVRLTGALDVPALTRALAQLVERHEVLRTHFEGGDAPEQVVSPRVELALPSVELSGEQEAHADARLSALSLAELEQPFDLARAPLLRVKLVRRSAREHVLLWTMHHIISDGWSAALLVGELGALYDAAARGVAPRLAPLRFQYSDFVRWQRELLQGEALERQLGYWTHQLAGAPETLSLATDFPRPTMQSHRGARHPIRLGKPLADALLRLGQQHGASLFMTLLAAYNVLLARCSEDEDIVVGAPVANRNRAESEGIMGLFVNTLALRTNLAGNPTFAELLAQVRDTTLAAYANQDVPFDRVVEAVQPRRDLSRTPVFQVMFSLQNVRFPPKRLGEVLLQIEESEHTPAQFDLTLVLEEGEDGIAGYFEYCRDLFVPETVARMAAHLERVLAAGVAHPQVRIRDLDLLSDAEREELVALSGTRATYSPALRLHHGFEQQARLRPDAPALAFEERVLTFGELDRRATRLATRLRALGVGPEVRVALGLHRSPSFVVGMLATLKAGGAYVPLEPSLPRDRLAWMLRDADARVLLTEPSLAPAFGETSIPILSTEEADEGPLPELAAPAEEPGLDALAYVLYTSGSTGRPKGVMITHRAICNRLAWDADFMPLSPADTVLQLAAISFDASVWEMWAALWSGARMRIVPADLHRDVPYVAELIAREQVTCALFVPSHLEAMLEEPAFRDCRSLRYVLAGGETLPSAVMDAFLAQHPETRLYNCYGPTECTIDTTLYLCEPGMPGRSVPIGRPVPNLHSFVLDRYLKPVARGGLGELCIAGAGIARGYLGREDLTAERFVQHPLAQSVGGRIYRTGDRARFLPDGNIEFHGRLDAQVKIRGLRIELGEIESVLRAQPGVAEAVVLPRSARAHGEGAGYDDLVAFVVLDSPTRALPEADLRAAVRKAVPAYMVPAAVVTLEALPVLSSGKIDRRALEARLPEAGAGSELTPPRTEMERLVASAFQEVLELERVGVEDDFFGIGGHSLLATQVVSRLRRALQLEFPLRTLFDSPTVAGLAAHLDGLRAGLRRTALPVIPRASRTGPLPLSFAQERLWVLEQLEPGGAAYHIAAALRAEGSLDVDALRASLTAVVERHEALRTGFVEQEGRAAQVVLPPLPIALPIDDLTGLEGEAREAGLSERMALEARTPFDLRSGPLLRARLVKRGEREHVLLLTVHHIAADGWSMGVLVREVSELYTAHLAGRTASLPPLPIQSADHAAWQRAFLLGERLERELEFWRKQFQGAPHILNLPTDRPRPPVRTTRGALYGFRLPAALTPRLHALCRAEGVTPFMVLLSAFGVLLSRYARQEELLIGSPVANREQLETEGLIGFFVNTLVLRLNVEGSPSFRDLLARVRETTLAAYAHQELPFEKLVDSLGLERDLSRTPLFQVMFALQNAGETRLAATLPGVTLTQLETDARSSKFDLTLSMVEEDGALQGLMEYSTDLFEAPTIQRMAGHLGVLLEAALGEPTTYIGALSLLTGHERADLLRAQIGAPTFEVTEPLHHLFERQARRAPSAVAVTHEGQSLTYGELDARANRLARELRGLGVGPDRLVGLWLDRSVELVVAILGVLKAGGAYLPLDPAYPRERVAFMLEDAAAVAVVTQQSLRAALPANVPALVVMEDAGWQTHSAEPLAPVGGPDDLAYVIYTSGSTGRPKGVLITHRNVMRLFLATDAWFHFGPSDVWTLFHSSAFDFSVWELWGALLYGGRLVVVPYWVSRAPDAFHQLVAREQVTVLNQTPSAFRQFVAVDGQSAEPVPLALRSVIFGGEALELQSLRPWFERRGDQKPVLVNMYGITETTVHVTYRPLSMRDLDQPASVIGEPIPDLRIHLLDPNLSLVPVGVPGEICVAGAGLARGYLNRPELTSERFCASPYPLHPGEKLYRSGDLARALPNGDLEYLGRIDHQVKIRGFRIELGELEAALVKSPHVREAVVIARAEGAGEKRLVAYWVPTSAADTRVSAAELRAFLKQSVPEYAIPSAFVQLEAIPLTQNGKVAREALPTPGSVASMEREIVAPRTEAEGVLAAIWKRVLRIEQVSLRDNFFEVGGDSILAIQVATQARQAGVQITPRDVFRFQTLEELAAEAKAGPVLEAEQGLVTGEVPLLPIQAWFFEQRLVDPHHWNQAVWVGASRRLKTDVLERALAELVMHHDALRLRFREAQAVCVPPGDATPLDVLELTGVAPAEAATSVEALAARVQGSLDLERGPLFRAALVLQDGDSRLLLVAHHLVVDAVSWRILLEDLESSYLRLESGAAGALPAKTTSYRAFSLRRQDPARGASAVAELEGWLAQPWSSAVALPQDLRGINTEGSARAVSVRLGRDVTAQLLALAPTVLKAQPEEVLLTALAHAFAQGVDAPALVVDLEGHGRDSADADIDVSRTVGWFTSLYPMLLPTARGELVERLREVKHRLRGVPNRGANFGLLRYSNARTSTRLAELPRAQVSFNYLGRLDASGGTGESLLRPLAQETGPTRSPNAIRHHALDVTAAIFEGQLRIDWSYSPALHLQARIQALAEAFAHAVRALLEQAASAPALPSAFIPSDFPLAHVAPGEIAPLFSGDRELEDLYALSPMQEAFLLSGLTEGGSGLGVEQTRYTLVGTLAIEDFERAWNEVVAHHPVLRTDFVVAGVARPVQRVHRRATLRLERQDLRHLPATEQREHVSRYLAQAARDGLDVSRPPLMRLAVFRCGEDMHQVVWSHHHLLLDGWSVGLVLQEVTARYAALREGGRFDAGAARPFRDYIAWLQRQDPAEAERYWRRALEGLRAPTPIAIPRRAMPTTALLAHGEREVRLPAALSERLRTLARRNRLTLGAVLQGAWALWLARHSRGHDVVFGSTVAGRPAELAGTDTAVGLFINVVPVRARLDGKATVLQALTTLTGELTEQRRFEHVPLSRIQDWSEVSSGLPLFESLVVIENYPLNVLTQQAMPGLRVAEVDATVRTRFPLALVVTPDAEIAMHLAYDARRFDAATLDGALRELAVMLESIAERPEQAVEELVGPRASGRLTHLGLVLEPVEVEAALCAIPEVTQAAVVSRGDRLVAHVATQQGVSDRRLRELSRLLLPAAFVPASFVRWDVLPRTPAGEVDGSALEAKEGLGRTSRFGTPLEEKIAALWSELMGTEVTDPDDDFFDLGGHSLIAIQMISRVQSQFGVQLAVRDVFGARTVSRVAAAIAKAGTVGSDGAVESLHPAAILARHPIQKLPPLAHYELSPYQYPEFYFHELAPDSPMYNMLIAEYLFVGEMDVDAFLRACQTLLDRHAIFRTTFGYAHGKPGQRITPELRLNKEDVLLDCRDVPEERFVEATTALAEQYGKATLDFESGPIFRMKLAEFSGKRFMFVFLTNHIVWDEVSTMNMGRELRELYNAYVRGTEPAVPTLAYDYVDYAHWVNRAVESGLLARQRAYWLEQFKEVPPSLDLPLDFARPAQQTFVGGDVMGWLSDERSRQLVHEFLVRRPHITQSVFFLSVFNLLLHRLSGQDDLVVGVPIANRPIEALEALVGPFTTAMPLRCRLRSGMRFEDLLEHTHQVELEALDHYAYPSVLAIQEINPEMDLSRGRLFSVMFGLQNNKTRFWSELKLDGLEIIPLPHLTGTGPLRSTSRADLRLMVEQVGDAFSYTLSFNSDLFKRSTAERMANQFIQLVHEVLDAPGKPLLDYELLTPAERQKVLVDFNRTDQGLPLEGAIHERFEAQAALTPDRLAVESETGAWTYREVNETANRWAHLLRARGLRPEDKVGLHVDISIDLVVGVLAVLKAGGAYVPLAPEQPTARKETILESAGARVLLSSAGLMHGGPRFAGVTFQLDAPPPELRGQPVTSPERVLTADSVACVFFTSGSTGTPKGIEVRHQGINNLIHSTQDVYRMGRDGASLFITPYNFDVSLLDLFWPISVGARIALPRPEDGKNPARIAALIDRHRVSVLQIVPVLLDSLVAAREQGSISGLPSLEVVMCAGAVLTRHLRDRCAAALRARLANHYGPTEATVDVSRFDTRLPFDGEVVPIGRPIANTRLYVLDRALRPMPPGVPGEIYISGVGLARGYLDDPEKTARRFLPDPFAGLPGARMYATGDLGALTDEGVLQFIGRVDRQVKVRGNRVEIEEIETRLASHPAVGRSVVQHLKSPGGNDFLVATLEPRESASEVRPGIRMFSLAQRPELARRLDAVHTGSWAPYFEADAVQRELWPRIGVEFPAYQVGLVDASDAVVAVGNAVPLRWDGTPEGIPPGWDAALQRAFAEAAAGEEPNTLCVLAGVVAPESSGQGYAELIVQAFRALASGMGLARLLVPVRPTQKAEHPELDFPAWCAARREDGLPQDRWLRTHIRAGGRILRVDTRSQYVRAPIAKWEEWYGRRFERSGEYVLPDALQPVHMDLAAGVGEYHDPSVWVEHTVDPQRTWVPLDGRAIRGYLREFLPEYMVPEHYRFIGKMPLTLSGKVDAKALPRFELSGSTSEMTVAPQTPMQEEIAGVWRTLLETDRVGITDDFFSLGGHSIRAVQMLARVNDVFTVNVSLREFYRDATIRGLEQAIVTRARPTP